MTVLKIGTGSHKYTLTGQNRLVRVNIFGPSLATDFLHVFDLALTLINYTMPRHIF